MSPYQEDRIKESLDRNGFRFKLREFESLRRHVERELCFWVGHRYGSASSGDEDSGEFERLQRCKSGGLPGRSSPAKAGDFVRFYLATARPMKAWPEMSTHHRWHWLRGAASPYYSDGTAKPEFKHESWFVAFRNPSRTRYK